MVIVGNNIAASFSELEETTSLTLVLNSLDNIAIDVVEMMEVDSTDVVALDSAMISEFKSSLVGDILVALEAHPDSVIVATINNNDVILFNGFSSNFICLVILTNYLL
jgi:hypothetical protein